jgi:glycosyltransferase involved in cell wall biosynthesis
MISFVVPAHDEEQCLATTLRALNAAANEVGEPFEVIVVNDASTDRTGAIGLEFGARVIEVKYRLIAAARNAGARVARGDILFFVDADTQANAPAIRAGLRALAAGAVGGGCVWSYDGPIPWWARILHPIGTMAGRLIKLVGGAFLFCRRADFEAVGGFCERYFAAEDVAFVNALKRRGHFVIPRETVVTSNRKLGNLSVWRALALLWRLAVHGPESFRGREGLELWYGPEAREQPVVSRHGDKPPNTA